MTRAQLTIMIVVLLTSIAVATGLVVYVALRDPDSGQPTVTPSPSPWPPANGPTAARSHRYPRHVPARPVGRHHADTVRPVPDGWMPVTGEDRLRALEETRRFDGLNPDRKEGGSR